MLIEFSVLLASAGLVMLIVGILVSKQYTLRSKLLTAFLVISLLSIGVLAVIDNYLMRESLTLSAHKALQSAAKQSANRVDQFNLTTMESLQTIARMPAISKYLSKSDQGRRNDDAVVEILNVLHAESPYALSYGVLSSGGINLVDSKPTKIGLNEKQNNYFTQLLEGQKAYRSPVIFFTDKHASVFFSSAILDANGKLQGVLRAEYSADIYRELLKTSRGSAGIGSFAILLDENMLRLAHGRRADLQYTLAEPVNPNQLERLKQKQYVPQLTRLDSVEHLHWVNSVKKANFETTAIAKQFYGLGDELFTATVENLNSAPWRVVIAQPQEIVLQPVADQTSITLLFTGAVAVLVIIIVFGTTSILLGPVRRLTTVVSEVASGGLDKKAIVEADDEVGSLAGAFNTMTDNIQVLVSDLEDEIKKHEITADHLRKLSQAIEQSPSSVMITDLEGTIEYVNPEFSRSSGYSEDEVIGKNARILNSGHTPTFQFTNLWNTIKAGNSWNGELYNKRKNGELYWESVTVSPIKNKEGEATHYLAIKEDITLRKDYEEKLLYQATYDKLTDLPNRSLAFDRLQHAIAIASKEKRHLALLYIDFDHFKNINDTLGHSAGDKFLIMMAERLKGCVEEVDTVARLGGDEYLIILSEYGGHLSVGDEAYQKTVQDKAKEILKDVALPCFIEDKEFSITASIGIAIYPNDGDDPHVLLRNADTAMYRSKRKGRNTLEMYAQEMNDTVVKRVEIESKLLHALEDQKFYLMYQPLVDAQTKQLVGAETLLRWHDDELGEISPEIFVPFAEESGLIVDISNWVIEKSCEDLKKWHEITGNDRLYSAINLSSRQFRDKGIVQVVNNALSRNELPGYSVELEITERMLMKDIAEVIATLNQFKEMGIYLSIDDFGTGYSSLSYLKRFPFDVLKVDRAFVKDIGNNPDDESLCDAVIAIAHSLGLKVIGEGVETEEQYVYLRDRGTEVIQGYYFSRPQRYEEFIEQLTSPSWL